MKRTLRFVAVAGLVLACRGAHAQFEGPSPDALLASQREAMQKLAPMDGAWRGTATTTLPDGSMRSIVQTERIGPFLGGAVKVIEGRGYDDAGRAAFNALGIVSYDPASSRYAIRSYAQGRAGDFRFEPTADGYRWEIPVPGATIRYTATIRDGVLNEVGERVVPDRPPQRFFEMTLRRISDTSWPADGAIPPR
jgi:hypothetical protein